MQRIAQKLSKVEAKLYGAAINRTTTAATLS
jgi:hypothetical protein